jgi:general secretion pathway protein C
VQGLLMKQPVWIINSALLFLCILGMFMMYINRPEHLERQEIVPEVPIRSKPRVTTKIDISSIYDNDLFNTYQPPLPEPVLKDYTKNIPAAPMPQPLYMPQEGPPHFLEPLPIRVTGIIIVGDQQKDTAMITNIKTQEEIRYRVGDKVQDAQLIQILPNRIILIRSNGQQEILYLRREDALKAEQEDKPWGSLIERLNNSTFRVDPDEFADKAKNLGNVIDLLDLTTAYKSGNSIGCRIGISGSDSLAFALGFNVGDIIQEINNMPTNSIQDRLAIYDYITSRKSGDSITIDFLRLGKKMKHIIILGELESKKNAILRPGMVIAEKTDQEIEEEKIKLLEQKHHFAPTINQIREQERKTLLQQRKRPTALKTRNRLSK